MKVPPSASSREPLLQDFAAATPEAWREAAEALLKGAPFEKIMPTRLSDEITLEPIYWRNTLEPLDQARTQPGFDGYLRGTSAAGYLAKPWDIAQELPYGDPFEYNRAVRADLMRGLTALNVSFDLATLAGLDPDGAQAGEVGACGLSVADLADFRRAFDGIEAEALPIHLRTGTSGLVLGALFLAWLKESGADPKQCTGGFNMDPLAVWAASGGLPVALNSLYDEMAALAIHCQRHAPGFSAAGVTGLPYHQAGASAMQELGLMLATGIDYLRALTERGLSVNEAARQIRFSFAVGPNFFLEIAKFRAARVLWAQAVEAFGGDAEAQKMRTHARTGLRNKTRHDPHVNMLRTTTEALSAVLGGVDSLTVGTFDEVVRVPDNFSRRVARNVQVILQEECELTAVVDPAGGSWAIESLTDQVATESWKLFQQIEAEGGMAQALEKGSVASILAKTRAEEEKQLSQRRLRLVGTNVYPNPEEKPLAGELPDYHEVRDVRASEVSRRRVGTELENDAKILEHLENLAFAKRGSLMPELIDAATLGASLGELTRAVRGGQRSGPLIGRLPQYRLAAGYERLRAAAETFKAARGSAPRIFLTTLGALRRHKARADFTRGFFEPGGFEVLAGRGFAQPAEAVAALKETGAPITVVCGTDEDYADHFETFARAIKAASPEVKVILAGFPGDNEERFRAAGMDDYIFIKSDNYQTNLRYLVALGVLPA